MTWRRITTGGSSGRVTDAVWSPGLERNIGYVWVPIDLAAPGTRLTVESEHGDMAGTRPESPSLTRGRNGPPSPSSARPASPRASGGRRPDSDGRQRCEDREQPVRGTVAERLGDPGAGDRADDRARAPGEVDDPDRDPVPEPRPVGAVGAQRIPTA